MSVTPSSAVIGRGAALANVAPAFGQSGICLFRPAIAHDRHCFTWSCWQERPHPILGLPATHENVRGSGCFIKDAARSYDSYRYVAVAIRAYFYACASHDGTKWVLPETFFVARYVKTGGNVDAVRPYTTCCWDFSGDHWDLLGDGAPADETVDRSAWPQAIFDGMGAQQSSSLDDTCGNTLTTWQFGGGPIYSRSGSVHNGDLVEIGGRSCLLTRILPRGVAHDLVIVAQIWKRVLRNQRRPVPSGFPDSSSVAPTAREQANVSLTCHAAISLPIKGGS